MTAVEFLLALFFGFAGVLAGVIVVSRIAKREFAKYTDRESRIVGIAETIGEHWRDQQAVNSGLLDMLEKATRPEVKS